MNKQYLLWKEQINLEDYLQEEINKMSEIEIEECFGKDLEFGTAGLRGVLGAGTNRMNIYVVRKITIGLAMYLKEKYPNEKISVAIAYDSRNFSKEFMEIVTKVLATYEIYSYVYDDVKPTPLLSYLLRKKQSKAGIMITASHNPKEYNGYKVYNETGCQINEEEAREITKKIATIDDMFNFEYKNNVNDYVTIIKEEIEDEYIKEIKKLSNNNLNKNIKIVFTPEHGTSYRVFPKLLNACNYKNIINVEEQMMPDGNFSNTKSSNPEEEIAFELALEYAKNNDADLIIANDPDADRLGIMCKKKIDNNEYIALTGNQTGTLMIDYLINNYQIDNNKIIYKTIVTGEMGANIAKNKGIEIKELLTGFKYIGEQIELLENKNNFLFGYEESYGYLINPIVRDKDALQAGLLIADMCEYYKNEGITLYERLLALYDEYGFYEEKTYSITLKGIDGIEKINNAINYFRSNKLNNILNIDINNQIDYLIDNTGLPKANVIKLYLKNYGWIVLRPSGTEPKLKIYISIKEQSLEQAKSLNEKLYQEILKIIGL